MQKCLIKYSESEQEANEDNAESPNIPKTSNALCGFFKSKYIGLSLAIQCSFAPYLIGKYSELERSTNYVTPKQNLKHKITDQIYENIIIG